MMMAERFLQWIAAINKNRSNNNIWWFLGPPSAAHCPTNFAKSSELQAVFRRLCTTSLAIKTTVATYGEHHRVENSANGVWAFGVDFDFDRGPNDGIARALQEDRLWQVFQACPPSAAVETRNGYHFYWVLRGVYGLSKFYLPAKCLTDTIGADRNSASPTQCLSIYSEYPKPARMVEYVRVSGHRVDVFPRTQFIYTMSRMTREFVQEVSPALTRLQEMVVGRNAQKRLEVDPERTERILRILGEIDVQEVLKAAGYQPRLLNGGRKLVVRCMYHNDSRPSAFINMDPNDSRFGLFHCSACGTSKSILTVLKDVSSKLT